MEVGADLRAKSFAEFRSPEGRSVEKNWVFFGHGDAVFCVYHAGRGNHEVHAVSGGQIEPRWATANPMLWHWGEIRGGTNTVFAEGQYWTFFHSHHLYPGTRRYFMGAYAFDARPPFRITAYTPMPLYTPPEPSRSLLPHDVKHVIFPGGLLKVDDEWLIFSGYNDEAVIVSRVNHFKLKELMVQIPTERSHLIRAPANA